MKSIMKKSVLAAMVIGMTVSGAAGVYAGTNLQKITAYLNSGIGIQINGEAYHPTDANGKKLNPISYQDSTYLPVRALAEALHVPLAYDAENNQILIGSTAPVTNVPVNGLSEVKYSDDQTADIIKAFAGFEAFETAYAPKQMAAGDAYHKAVATDDGVNLVFTHMIVNVSPRDYSIGYDSKDVTLTNGTQAKWVTPGDTPMLSFKLDDRIVTISSPDHSLSNTQIEQLAVSVVKLTK